MRRAIKTKVYSAEEAEEKDEQNAALLNELNNHKKYGSN